MKHIMPVILCLITATVPKPGIAGDDFYYRTGEPAVLSDVAPRAGADQAVEERTLVGFRRVYAAAGRPRMAILWHRDLTDEISSHKKITGSVTTEPPSTLSSQLSAVQRTVTITFDTGGSGHSVPMLSSSGDAQFQTGFESTLRSAGVRLVDRNTAMRLTALKNVEPGTDPATLDTQAVEMSALVKHSDYFVEISFVPGATKDKPAPRIAVIASASGEVLVDVMPSLSADAGGGSRWAATEQGFVRVETPSEGALVTDEGGFHRVQPKPDGVTEGRTAALALMEQLVQIWTPAIGETK